MDILGIDQVQTLGKTGISRALALAGTGIVRAAENGEEITAVVVAVVRKHGRPGAGRQSAEARPDLGQIVNRVEQNLRLKTLRVMTGKVVLVLDVVVIGNGAELIGFRPGNVPDQLLGRLSRKLLQG